jgi:hypothetical protein
MGETAAWTISVARVNVHPRVRQRVALVFTADAAATIMSTSLRHAAAGASAAWEPFTSRRLAQPCITRHPSPITTITSQAIPCSRTLLCCFLLGLVVALCSLRRSTHKLHDVPGRLHNPHDAGPRLLCRTELQFVKLRSREDGTRLLHIKERSDWNSPPPCFTTS